MTLVNASYSRDNNRVPIDPGGIVTSTTKNLTGSNETAIVPIFRITGSVEFKALYGIVTTTLGSNNTAAYWRINDQTAQVAMTAATGTTISAAPAGSMILKNALNAVALVLKSSAAGALSETSSANTNFFQRGAITQKTGSVNTDVEFVYTTTDTPTSGAIQFFFRWLPLSSDGNVTAL